MDEVRELRGEVAQLRQRIAELEGAQSEVSRTRAWAPELAVTDELAQLLAELSDYLWSARVLEDGSFEYRYYSPVVERITGRPPQFFLEGGWLSTLHPEDVPRLIASARGLIEGFEPTVEERYRIFKPDGEQRWLRDRVTRVIRPGGEMLLNGIVRDVTEQVQAEERERALQAEIQRAQHMEGLGLLAGGIAHDFNNLLVGVLGSLDLALTRLPADAEARVELGWATDAASQCAELCRQLLAYSGKGQFVIETFSLAALIEGMSRLLGITIVENHTINYELDREVAPLSGDPTQFRQVVMNLVTNASEALGSRAGGITLRSGLVEVHVDELDGAFAGELEPGPHVYLEVEDDGEGMSEDRLARIFDPFFTTKGTGHGLGLAAVLGIVRGHGGAIWVSSEVGEGTRFRLLFPAADGAGLTEAGAVPVASEPRRWSGVAMVVDDEPSVRRVSKHMLEDRGFDVVVAEDGAEAVALYAERGAELRLVLLDMSMPKLDGMGALTAIRAIDADAKVVMMSGYNEDALERELEDHRHVLFLDKPFRISALDQALAQLLDANAELT